MPESSVPYFWTTRSVPPEAAISGLPTASDSVTATVAPGRAASMPAWSGTSRTSAGWSRFRRARRRSHQPEKSGSSCAKKWEKAASRAGGVAGSRMTWSRRGNGSSSTTTTGRRPFLVSRFLLLFLGLTLFFFMTILG
ncbi:hypothetical protein D3C83_18720 [compost metagenome]